jgi:signal transduction histidine kinase
VSAAELAEQVRTLMPAALRTRVDLVVEDGADDVLVVPVSPLAQALANLAKNGLEASRPDDHVRLCVGGDQNGVQIVVEDHGSGMSDDIKAQVGDPFFTTKAIGTGMGLGVFLARLVTERLGGELVIDSSPGEGTRALLDLPRIPHEMSTDSAQDVRA